VTQPAAGACYGSNETIEVEVFNYGLNTIDFSQSNVRVVSISSGLNPRRDTVVLNSDTLAPGQTRLVTMNTSYDMSVLGVYTFEGFTEFITGWS
jgi:predicted extracellular nuclease